MALNKSKKFAKSKKPAPAPVPEPVEELDEEIEELDEEVDEEVDEDEDEMIEEVKPVTKSKKSKKVARVETDDDDDDDDNEETISFDTDSVVNGIVTDKRNLTSSVYQVQLRLPSDIEPMYKGLTPRVKKALRDAFAELVRKTYDKLH